MGSDRQESCLQDAGGRSGHEGDNEDDGGIDVADVADEDDDEDDDGDELGTFLLLHPTEPHSCTFLLLFAGGLADSSTARNSLRCRDSPHGNWQRSSPCIAWMG